MAPGISYAWSRVNDIRAERQASVNRLFSEGVIYSYIWTVEQSSSIGSRQWSSGLHVLMPNRLVGI